MRALLALLPVAALVAAPLLTPACTVTSTASNDDAGSASAVATGDAAAAVATVQGADCAQIASTVSLCEYISICPNLVLNAQVFPQCGFRIHGTAIDPECLCEGHYLCPIGSNLTSCAQAASAASGDTTYDSVCEEAVLGSCTDLTPATGSSSGGSGSSSGGTSSACQTCIQNCDNVPACIDACSC